MVALKTLGIVVGLFVLVGVLFIEPSRQWSDTARMIYVDAGALLGVVVAVVAIRRVLRAAPRREKAFRDMSTRAAVLTGTGMGGVLAAVAIFVLTRA